MNQALKVLEWCKSNAIILACGVVMLLALLSFIWPSMAKSSAFRKEMSERQSEVSKIQGLPNTSVEIPGPRAGAPPQPVQLVVNDASIEKLLEINSKIVEDTQSVGQYAVDVNQDGHKPMLEGLFPEPVTPSIRFDAQKAYKAWIEQLYTHLHPTTELSAYELGLLKEQVKEEYVRGLPPADQTSLKPDQETELARRQADAIQRAIRERAAAAHVYVQPVGLVSDMPMRSGAAPSTTPTEWKAGPFQVDPWVHEETPPDIEPIWESQMQLWIQQDLVTAIARANEIYNSDNTINTDTSIADQPVKELLYVAVLPPGASPFDPSPRGSAETRSGARPQTGGYPRPGGFPGGPGGFPGGPGGGADSDTDSASSAPSYSEYKEATKKRIEDNFVSPTGRRTNKLYDVRYAEMQVLVDSRQIPKLFNAISRTNFMTVIGTSMENVDEYEAFANGYSYGEEADVVRLTLRIETIWLRAWLIGHYDEEHFKEEQEKDSTAVFKPGLMPDAVRYKLNLPTRRPYTPREGAGGAGPTPGTPGGF